MDQNTLQMFLTLYESGSMHKAAERLFISQQGISKSIRALEQQLGTVLFQRSASGVTPTAAGELFYEEAKHLQAQYLDIQERIKNAAEGRKTVTLACAYGSLYYLFPLLKEFEKENPDIIVRWQELTDKETEDKLIREETDLAVNVYGMQAGFVSFTPIYSCSICLVVYRGHPLYEKNFIEFQDIDYEKIVIEGTDFQIYHQFRQFCENAKVHPNIIAETSDITFCHHMAEIGEGLAVTVEFVADDRRMENVRVIPFADPNFYWEIGVEKISGKGLSEEARKLEKFLTRRRRQLSVVTIQKPAVFQ